MKTVLDQAQLSESKFDSNNIHDFIKRCHTPDSVGSEKMIDPDNCPNDNHLYDFENKAFRQMPEFDPLLIVQVAHYLFKSSVSRLVTQSTTRKFTPNSTSTNVRTLLDTPAQVESPNNALLQLDSPNSSISQVDSANTESSSEMSDELPSYISDESPIADEWIEPE